jgi:hypothetical protein
VTYVSNGTELDAPRDAWRARPHGWLLSGASEGGQSATRSGSGSFLQAFLRALRMSDDEYAIARAAFGHYVRAADASNIAALDGVLDEGM